LVIGNQATEVEVDAGVEEVADYSANELGAGRRMVTEVQAPARLPSGFVFAIQDPSSQTIQILAVSEKGLLLCGQSWHVNHPIGVNELWNKYILYRKIM
jgi:hypothetical protein